MPLFDAAEVSSVEPSVAVVEAIPSDPADLSVYVYSTLLNARRFAEAEQFLCDSDINDLPAMEAQNLTIENMACEQAATGVISCTADIYANGELVLAGESVQIEYANGLLCSLD